MLTRARLKGLIPFDAIGDETRMSPAPVVAQDVSGRRVTDQQTQALNRVSRNERNHNRAGPEDTEPGGERRGATFEAESNAVARLQARLQQTVRDPRCLCGELFVAGLLSAGVHGRPLRLRLRNRLKSIGDRSARGHHDVGGLTIDQTRSRTALDMRTSSVTLCSTVTATRG